MAVPILPKPLTGNFLVRVIRPALHDAHRLLPRKRDRAILRRHSLKLRFWPDQTISESDGIVMDLDWSWIRALKGKKIGELRINNWIAGCDNLRVVFYVPEQNQKNQIEPFLPMIWILAVFQKKRDDFTKANIATFDARKVIVDERDFD